MQIEAEAGNAGEQPARSRFAAKRLVLDWLVSLSDFPTKFRG